MTKKTRIRIVLKSGHVEEFDTDTFVVTVTADGTTATLTGYRYEGMPEEQKLMFAAFDEIALVRRVK